MLPFLWTNPIIGEKIQAAIIVPSLKAKPHLKISDKLIHEITRIISIACLIFWKSTLNVSEKVKAKPSQGKTQTFKATSKPQPLAEKHKPMISIINDW